MSTSLIIDAAIGGPWEQLGRLIEEADQEDASGYRRHLAERLHAKDYEAITRCLGITAERAQALREVFVAAFGEEG